MPLSKLFSLFFLLSESGANPHYLYKLSSETERVTQVTVLAALFWSFLRELKSWIVQLSQTIDEYSKISIVYAKNIWLSAALDSVNLSLRMIHITSLAVLQLFSARSRPNKLHKISMRMLI